MKLGGMVLIIDSSIDIALLIDLRIKHDFSDYSTAIADCPKKALELIKQFKEQIVAIIIEVVLPVCKECIDLNIKNGVELLAATSRLDNIRPISVIFFTSQERHKYEKILETHPWKEKIIWVEKPDWPLFLEKLKEVLRNQS